MGTSQYNQQVSLTNCDREPIHRIPQIQSHGCLLVLNPKSFTITQVSANAHEVFQKKELLNTHFAALFPDLSKRFQQQLTDGESVLPEQVTINDQSWLAIPHLDKGHFLIDFEPAGEALNPLYFQEQLTQILNSLDQCKTLTDMCQVTAQLVKQIFDYDRVMLYQFDEEWNGKVIAEEKEKNLTSWLGLHYPSTDIPKPARDMFLEQGIRMITDVHYQPIELQPELSPLNQQPLHILQSELRGVSPIHIEYLQNMNVGASLTAAIVVNGKLWGLIACHHSTPKFVNYHLRQSCKFLTQVFSNKLAVKNTQTFIEKTTQSEGIRKALLAQMRETQNISKALCDNTPKFTDLVNCHGGALYLDENLYLLGHTPSKKEVIQLIEEYLNIQNTKLIHSRSLQTVFSAAQSYADKAAGVLSVKLEEGKNNYLIWFRQEESAVVEWGGNPQKKATLKDGIEYLSPRKSFERWSQNQSGRSTPWQTYELEAADSIGESVLQAIVEQQKEKISLLNRELTEVNNELETFSYSVSHDLRAPLRGIAGYASILKTKHSENWDCNAQDALATIIDAAEEMNILIEDMLTYAKAGKGRLRLSTFPMKALLENLLKKQNLEKNYPNTQVQLPDRLPELHADKRMIGQLFNNLLENALKYSAQQTHPQVSINYQQTPQNHVFSVTDNGIGFDDSLKDKIFDIFSRFADEEYEGSGIGLAIAKKVVEKHRGSIQVKSSPNQGATFKVYLPKNLFEL